MLSDFISRPHLFLGGEWVAPAENMSVEVAEASTERIIGKAAMGSRADIDAAVSAARTALEGPWKDMGRAERADILDRFATALTDRASATAELVSRENGMPIS